MNEKIEKEIDEIVRQLKELPFESPDREELTRRMNILETRLYANELSHRIMKKDANLQLKNRY